MKGTLWRLRWEFRQQYLCQSERLTMAIAWRLPRWLVYWCAIRLMSHATTGQYGTTIVPDLTAMDALKRWSIKS